MTAIENARKVLDAETAADRAVMDAKAALQAARDAKARRRKRSPPITGIEVVLIAALDAAIGYVEERVEAAREQAGSMALDAAVTAVQGTDTNNPMGPVSHGEAAAVGGALGRALTWLGFQPANLLGAGNSGVRTPSSTTTSASSASCSSFACSDGPEHAETARPQRTSGPDRGEDGHPGTDVAALRAAIESRAREWSAGRGGLRRGARDRFPGPGAEICAIIGGPSALRVPDPA